MAKSAVVGYPRIGRRRELKFWTEDYFKGIISAETLRKNIADLRKSQWRLQQQNGIDFIPSNDYSLYDSMLDTAYLLGIIPKAYKDLGLNELDTYFAMARGYQGDKGNIKALSMRKWFNTNYHYIVPVFDDNTGIMVKANKFFEQYLEALAIGIKTKPVLIGPFSFLMLADYQGKKGKADWAGDMVNAYREILDKFKTIDGEWLQLDEPALVMDLSEDDTDLFVSIYRNLLLSKGDIKILLQTYFGDIRDIYYEVISLGFNGIGLDFMEGKLTKELIQRKGFPQGALLFAGVVNGKNIWRNHYEKTLLLLRELEKFVSREQIVINTSCSLLHVPYTLSNESVMEERYKQHFAFAEEKLQELNDLKTLISDADYAGNPKYIENASLIRSKGYYEDKAVKDKIAALTASDFIRFPVFAEREKMQKEALGLPMLPTTTIGSFPQTAEVQALRTKWKKGEISGENYLKQIKDKIAGCIMLQEKIGFDVLVHGEYERNDMVEYFGENLNGFLITQNGWVQSYGTRCVKPPIIWSDVSRNIRITVEYSVYAQSLTKKPVKGMLTGPVTILNWSFPREDISNKEMAFQIALALKEEVADLEDAGIRIIQIDEAALKEKLPLRRADWRCDYLDWAIPAFRFVHATAKPTTQIHTHMCYSEFEDIIREIDDMDADVISFEAARSRHAIIDTLVKANFKTAVGPGVYDIHSPRVPSQEEIQNIIITTMGKIPSDKLWVNPDCGLKTRGEKETAESLRNLVNAVKYVRSVF